MSETWWSAEILPYLVPSLSHFNGIVPQLELDGIELLKSDLGDDNLLDSFEGSPEDFLAELDDDQAEGQVSYVTADKLGSVSV